VRRQLKQRLHVGLSAGWTQSAAEWPLAAARMAGGTLAHHSCSAFGGATLQSSQTMERQQKLFNDFRRVYNDERPHETLGQKGPATIYLRITINEELLR
jgi:hypothetical protein